VANTTNTQKILAPTVYASGGSNGASKDAAAPCTAESEISDERCTEESRPSLVPWLDG
jgi:hypothetical protein